MDYSGRAARMGRIVGLALYCWIAVEALLIFTGIDFVAGGGVDVWFATPTVLGFVALGAIVATLVTAILLMIWVYRAMTAARALTPTLKTTPGWAVGGFFVPVASLWMPHVTMTEILEGSGDTLTEYEKSGRRLVDFWWAAWIARTAASLFESWVARANQGVGVPEVSLMLIASVFGIVAALLLEAIIRRATRLQAGVGKAEIFA